MIRVASGKYRFRSIAVGPRMRPTAQKIRQALFNILQSNDISGKFLDLFAGSGAVGIEAASLGFESVFNDLFSKQILEKNVSFIEQKPVVLRYDYMRSLEHLSSLNYQFDCIFVDPPYAFKNYQTVIDYILEHKMLTEFGVIIIETDQKMNFEGVIDKVYDYSNTYLYYLRVKGEEE
jgi:16S rRNA (guanine(966)-N(2))-methyltransferase RsmD